MGKLKIVPFVIVLVSLFCLGFTTVLFAGSFETYLSLKVGGGPEDFHPDTIVGQRILLSCDHRRGNDGQGSIWAYDLDEEQAGLLAFEPALDFGFHPHGIHLLSVEGITYLFVINHREKGSSEIDRFVVHPDRLQLDHRFTDIVGSPNDLFAVAKNEFYYSDYKMFGGSIVHYKTTCEKIVKHKKMPNGLFIEGGFLYFSTTLNGHLYKTNLHTGKTKKLAKLKGGDNIMNYSSDELLVASHPSFLKFTKHVMDGHKLAPTLIYKVNKHSGKRSVFYAEAGETISAASTAFYFRNKLYLSQIFEPYFVVKK